jgi:hypothetical protein
MAKPIAASVISWDSSVEGTANGDGINDGKKNAPAYSKKSPYTTILR